MRGEIDDTDWYAPLPNRKLNRSHKRRMGFGSVKFKLATTQANSLGSQALKSKKISLSPITPSKLT